MQNQTNNDDGLDCSKNAWNVDKESVCIAHLRPALFVIILSKHSKSMSTPI